MSSVDPMPRSSAEETDGRPSGAFGWVAAALSLVLPGVGQLLRGRLMEAILFFATNAWFRLTLGGIAYSTRQVDHVWDATTWGALGLPEVGDAPLAVVLTVLLVALHLGAALDARRPGRLPLRPHPEK